MVCKRVTLHLFTPPYTFFPPVGRWCFGSTGFLNLTGTSAVPLPGNKLNNIDHQGKHRDLQPSFPSHPRYGRDAVLVADSVGRYDDKDEKV